MEVTMNVVGPLMFITLLAVYIIVNLATKDVICFYERRCESDRRAERNPNIGLDRRTNQERRLSSDRRKLLTN
jgi:hypothetical protein